MERAGGQFAVLRATECQFTRLGRAGAGWRRLCAGATGVALEAGHGLDTVGGKVGLRAAGDDWPG